MRVVDEDAVKAGRSDDGEAILKDMTREDA